MSSLQSYSVLLFAVTSLCIVGLLIWFVVLAWRGRGDSDTFCLALLRRFALLYFRCLHGVRGGDREHLPKDGPVILLANHRSGIDPPLLAVHTRRMVHFLMAREYSEVWWLKWLFKRTGVIPVNRDGNDLVATKRALKALRRGGVVGIFPEGGIQEEESPEWTVEETIAGDRIKNGAALLALRSGAPVVTAYIDGTPNYDSVLRAFLCLSKSRVFFSEPVCFQRTKSRVSSKSKTKLDETSLAIVRQLAELQARARQSAPAAGVKALSESS